jgi:hypothetical protein
MLLHGCMTQTGARNEWIAYNITSTRSFNGVSYRFMFDTLTLTFGFLDTFALPHDIPFNLTRSQARVSGQSRSPIRDDSLQTPIGTISVIEVFKQAAIPDHAHLSVHVNSRSARQEQGASSHILLTTRPSGGVALPLTGARQVGLLILFDRSGGHARREDTCMCVGRHVTLLVHRDFRASMRHFSKL